MNIGVWLDSFFSVFDYSILEFISNFQSEFNNKIINIITFFGSVKFTIFVAVLCLVLLFFKKTRKVALCMILAIIIGTLITNVVAKPLIDRARPYITFAKDKLYEWYLAAGAHVESDKSFPSGHTTAAFEMATVMFWSLKKKYSWLFLLAALLIALSRLYLMVHYPTDVLAGMFIGFFAGSISYLIIRFFYKKKLA